MRHPVARPSCAKLVALAASLMFVAGCDKLQPNGGNPTTALLRDGSDKVCIASDVQETLRGLIVPKPDQLQADVPMATRVQKEAGISVSYSMTTLKAFDKSVTKTSCSTTVSLSSATSEEKGSFTVDFEISPSAEDANSFVVSANAATARALANVLAGDAINDVAAKNYLRQQEQETAQAAAQLCATVNPKWLRGAWIDANAEATSCGNGQAIWFEAGDVFEGVMGRGRWSLADDQLHVVAGGGYDKTGTIDKADAISFHVSWPDGSSFSLRRCTPDEIDAVSQVEDDSAADE